MSTLAGREGHCGPGITRAGAIFGLGGRTVRLVALDAILALAYSRGLRADGSLPEEILQALYVFNTIPEGEEAFYEDVALAAWEFYCCEREAGAPVTDPSGRARLGDQ